MPSHIYEAMHPYQRTGAHFLRRAGSALLADQPGLGKTIQSLATLVADRALRGVSGEVQIPRPPDWHLVVCPKIAVANVWLPEIHRWLTDKQYDVLTLTGSLPDRERAFREFDPRPGVEHVFVIVNLESLRIRPARQDDIRSNNRSDIIRYSVNRKDEGKVKMAYVPENGVLSCVFDREWTSVICDESHRALIRTDGVPTQMRAGFLLVKSLRRIALSGTPMRGKPEQLWGTLNWLRPDLYTSYWKWVKNYYSLTSNGYSNYIIAGPKPDGMARLAEDLKRLMLRRTKAEVLPDLPPKTYAGSYLIEDDDQSPLGVWLEMEPKQLKQYNRLASEAMIGDSFINNSLALYTRQRQIAGAYCDVVPTGDDKVLLFPKVTGSPKFEWLTEWLEVNEGEKIVVVSQFTSVLDAYQDALANEDDPANGYKVAKITGAVSDKNRTAAVEGFQNGDTQVMLLNIAAGGVALTLDAADYVVFLDETTIPDESEQAEDRVHRASRNHNVTIYFLRTLGTIEEEIAFVSAARQDVQQYLLDGSRGVEYARNLYLQSRHNERQSSDV